MERHQSFYAGGSIVGVGLDLLFTPSCKGEHGSNVPSLWSETQPFHIAATALPLLTAQRGSERGAGFHLVVGENVIGEAETLAAGDEVRGDLVYRPYED